MNNDRTDGYRVHTALGHCKNEGAYTNHQIVLDCGQCTPITDPLGVAVPHVGPFISSKLGHWVGAPNPVGNWITSSRSCVQWPYTTSTDVPFPLLHSILLLRSRCNQAQF